MCFDSTAGAAVAGGSGLGALVGLSVAGWLLKDVDPSALADNIDTARMVGRAALFAGMAIAALVFIVLPAAGIASAARTSRPGTKPAPEVGSGIAGLIGPGDSVDPLDFIRNAQPETEEGND